MRTNYTALPGVRVVVLVFVLVSMAPFVGAAEEQPYLVGPEDIVTVRVARHAEFSGDFYIPSDGVLELPGAGRIMVRGRSLPELAESVADGLKTRLRDPEVTVTLKQPRMQRVYVLGAVASPGLYDVKPGWRITEAMAAARGLSSDVDPGDCKAIILRAATGKRESTALADVLSGQIDKNALVHSGDVLTIEAQPTLPVYLMGQVRNPGLYRARTDSAGLVEALALAGGITDSAAITRVSITRLSGEVETVDLSPDILEGDSKCKVKLQSGDLVLVPENNARVAVLGHVNQPGFYPLKNGRKLMLSDALGLASGIKKRGDPGKVVVIRTVNGTQERKTVNLHNFLKGGDVQHNPEIRPGDVIYVPQTGRLDWDTLLRSVTAIAISISPFVP